MGEFRLPCWRQHQHPAHKWILARSIYQCPGVTGAGDGVRDRVRAVLDPGTQEHDDFVNWVGREEHPIGKAYWTVGRHGVEAVLAALRKIDDPEADCNCLVPQLEGAGQHAPTCRCITGGDGS